MIRFLPFFLELAFFIFCVVDVAVSPDHEIRNLPKWGWLLLVILIPLFGGIAWLVAGRPLRQRQASQWAPGAESPEHQPPVTQTDDIDARLKADLAAADQQHEEALRKWQADLERRERELREQEGDGQST
jgi:hypothetical protein